MLYEHDIIINTPPHVFGDGQHETTREIMRFMSQTDMTNKEVVDVGCGSGILSVYASKLGAKHITALDFDSRAVENTRQNLERNGVTNADVYWLDFMQTDLKADIIIANLPRETCAFCMPKIKESLNDGGTIIASWFKELPVGEMLDGWEQINHYEGITYDCYVLQERTN